jgi:radical SAM superfamily enzyme YgiQ (UPF0313 family)
MITLINPPGIKTFSGLQMHTPNPPLGLAYVAAALKAAGLPYQVVDGTGEVLDLVRPYPDRADFMIQGAVQLWPLANKLAWAVREKFPHAWMVLGGEHGTAVSEHALKVSPFDAVVLGEAENTVVALLLCQGATTDNGFYVIYAHGPGRLLTASPRRAPRRARLHDPPGPSFGTMGSGRRLTRRDVLNSYQKETDDEADAFGNDWRDGDSCGDGSECGLSR